MKRPALESFEARFSQIVTESTAFVDLEKRVAALEEANRTKVSFVRIEPKDPHGTTLIDIHVILQTIRDLE